MEAERGVAKALVHYRYNGPNKAKKELLVTRGGVINRTRFHAELTQIVVNIPRSILWSHSHGTLNPRTVDVRLANAVVRRPNLSKPIRDAVRETLTALAKTVERDGSDDDSDDESP